MELSLSLLAVIALVQAIAFGCAGGLLLKPINQYGDGFVLGFFLGPAGCIIAWAVRANALLEMDRKERHQPPTRAPAALTPQPAGAPPRPPKEPRRFK